MIYDIRHKTPIIKFASSNRYSKLENNLVACKVGVSVTVRCDTVYGGDYEGNVVVQSSVPYVKNNEQEFVFTPDEAGLFYIYIVYGSTEYKAANLSNVLNLYVTEIPDYRKLDFSDSNNSQYLNIII